MQYIYYSGAVKSFIPFSYLLHCVVVVLNKIGFNVKLYILPFYIFFIKHYL